MPRYGRRSKEELSTCHPNLQALFNRVLKHFDHSVLKGHREEAEQNEAYRTGRSKLKFPESKHNGVPSTAVDAAPYPINWKDTARFYYFAGVVKGIALEMGIPIRWGGDWDGDTDLSDQSFNDLVHFELVQ